MATIFWLSFVLSETTSDPNPSSNKNLRTPSFPSSFSRRWRPQRLLRGACNDRLWGMQIWSSLCELSQKMDLGIPPILLFLSPHWSFNCNDNYSKRPPHCSNITWGYTAKTHDQKLRTISYTQLIIHEDRVSTWFRNCAMFTENNIDCYFLLMSVLCHRVRVTFTVLINIGLDFLTSNKP